MSKLKTAILILLIGLLAIFLQGSVLRNLLPASLVPNLMVALVVFLAFFDNSPFGAVLVFLLGLQFDFYGGQSLVIGPSAGSLVVVFGVLASLSQRVYIESSFALLFVGFMSALLNSVVHIILTYERNASVIRFLSISLLAAIITGCVTPLIFRALEKLFRRRDMKRKLSRVV